MLIDLGKVVFENDFFNVDLPNGSVLTLNKLDEAIATDDSTVKIDRVNLQITSFDEDGNEEYMRCPCAIGLGNDILIIKTDYPEYEGKVLTSENMRFCTIEVYEQ